MVEFCEITWAEDLFLGRFLIMSLISLFTFPPDSSDLSYICWVVGVCAFWAVAPFHPICSIRVCWVWGVLLPTFLHSWNESFVSSLFPCFQISWFCGYFQKNSFCFIDLLYGFLLSNLLISAFLFYFLLSTCFGFILLLFF